MIRLFFPVFLWVTGSLALGQSGSMAAEQSQETTPKSPVQSMPLREWQPALFLKSEDGQSSLKVLLLAQLRFTQNQPGEEVAEGSFRVRRAKLIFLGKVANHWRYRLLGVWSGRTATLEEMNIQYTRFPWFQPWFGEGKVAFGRQWLIPASRQLFVDRSAAALRFTHGHDQGLMLVGHNRRKKLGYQVGVFNGNGRNQSADDDANKLVTGRWTWAPLGVLPLSESDPGPPEQTALHLGAAFTRGRPEESDARHDEMLRWGVELGFRRQGFQLAGEWFAEDLAEREAQTGYYLQAGQRLGHGHWEMAFRFSRAPGQDQISPDLKTTALAVNRYLVRHHLKIQADLTNLRRVGHPDDWEARLQFQVLH